MCCCPSHPDQCEQRNSHLSAHRALMNGFRSLPWACWTTARPGSDAQDTTATLSLLLLAAPQGSAPNSVLKGMVESSAAQRFCFHEAISIVGHQEPFLHPGHFRPKASTSRQRQSRTILHSFCFPAFPFKCPLSPSTQRSPYLPVLHTNLNYRLSTA